MNQAVHDFDDLQIQIKKHFSVLNISVAIHSFRLVRSFLFIGGITFL